MVEDTNDQTRGVKMMFEPEVSFLEQQISHEAAVAFLSVLVPVYPLLPE